MPDLSCGRLRMDFLRLLDRRASDLLARRRSAAPPKWPKLDDTTSSGRLIKRPDNMHINQAFNAGRLRFLILQNAVREICQFRAKLNAFREFMVR